MERRIRKASIESGIESNWFWAIVAGMMKDVRGLWWKMKEELSAEI